MAPWGEPIATSASAIAGVDSAPTEDDIARTADSILTGAFRGDFAVALTRASVFVGIVALGLRVEARNLTQRANLNPIDFTAKQSKRWRTQAAQLLHTAANLNITSKDFKHGAALWCQGKLE